MFILMHRIPLANSPAIKQIAITQAVAPYIHGHSHGVPFSK
jgi:hypothetical protein